MAQPTQIHLIRHGAVHNPHRLFYGRLSGFPISEAGQRQARAAAETLGSKPLVAIFSSPQLRARETAQIIAARHAGLTVRICDLIDEINTPYDGLPLGVLAERSRDVYAGNEPPYEQPQDVLSRMQRFICQMRLQYSGQHVAAVSHGDPITFLRLWLKGMEMTLGNRMVAYPEYATEASITTLSYSAHSADGVPTVEYVVPHQRQEVER